MNRVREFCRAQHPPEKWRRCVWHTGPLRKMSGGWGARRLRGLKPADPRFRRRRVKRSVW